MIKISQKLTDTLEALAYGFNTPPQMAKYVGLSRENCRNRLSRLVSLGLVDRLGFANGKNNKHGYIYEYNGTYYETNITPAIIDQQFHEVCISYPALDMFVDVNHENFIQPPMVMA